MWMIERKRVRAAWALCSPVCTKALALALGNVFLNKSRASSSFSTLIVSAMATSSSARVFDRSSHSAFFSAQLLSRPARNFLSSSNAACVSDRSSSICTMATPMLPMDSVFASIACDNASTSFFFADIRPSYDSMALFSASVASARALLISSRISFKMPVISPLFGAYSLLCEPDRKATSCCLSTSGISWLLIASCLMTFAAGVCKKPPAIPFSRAAMAFCNAAMLVSYSVFSAANAFASFSRKAVDSAIASFAAARST
mmetsp:Transcript_32680/g.64362  ORF Transcript_32680/g.64362 Transcript_32680/m.64362 type:complete len:259 (-) Transcript_32680:390-1166(-)